MKFTRLTRRAIFLATVSLLLLSSLTAPVLAKPESSLALIGIGTVQVANVQVESFDQSDAWEHYSSPNSTELGVAQGVYRAYTPNPGYAWGLNSQAYRNLVAEVEITPLTIYTDTAAGVMCRADISNNGDGYY
jgi:opacity protein-like surface antigen